MKPKIGQTVLFKNETVGIVTEIEGDICHYKRPDGSFEVFIWRHKDGTINTFHTWN
jgi:hypothetical protein